MLFKSINPKNGQILREAIPFFTREKLEEVIDASYDAYLEYKDVSVQERLQRIASLRENLEKNVETYAEALTNEMGKTLVQARAEVLKCADHCKYYEENTEEVLKTKHIETAISNSYVQYQATGPILIISPWNFPFWMPFRTAIPQLALGNTVLYKPAPNCSLSAELLEQAMVDSGLGDAFKLLYFDTEDTEFILSNHKVQGVGFTGSTKAGKIIASIAGKYVKKSLLELGGSDPFIVLEDADLDKAAQQGCISRLINNGQACINAKRFIVHEDVYDDFKVKLVDNFASKTVGDPLDESTNIGPLARDDLHENLRQQVISAVEGGATVALGDMSRLENPAVAEEGYYFHPMVLENITEENPIYRQELFGPVASLYKVSSLEDAVKLANDSNYGLGGAVFTEDLEKAKSVASQIDTGMMGINSFCISDPKLPNGGVKESGIGRECSHEGLLEFANIKSVSIPK
ncbi:unnamed protein product [Moneuplotes crassus]|uniref:Aldehyde dehydrogenase domain-containing protein n=1 Tax=Euplotes crassus TaxID=5936 RepID=A0AAD1XEL9_EUPCR|nr:unnamed protein product [Moneuplotes crassus]